MNGLVTFCFGFILLAPADAFAQTVGNIGISVTVQNMIEVKQNADGTIDCADNSGAIQCPAPVVIQTPDGPAMIVNW